MPEKERIYLDNAATTKPCEEAVAAMLKVLNEDYGNPSSLHQMGVEAEGYLRRGRETFASLMKVDPSEIIFTSGGTESNNLAITGTATALRRKGNVIVTTAMEHPAVSEPFRALGEAGFEVRTIPVDRKGALDMKALEDALDDGVILVSTMMVNNEIGAVVPVGDVSKLIKRKAPNAVCHVDAIQAFGKYRIYPRTAGIDLLSVSGHKLHGPKGTGLLYVSSKVRLSPVIFGGGQQKGLRSGTENVPGIAGFAAAAEKVYSDLDANVARMISLRERLRRGLLEIDGVTVLTPEGEHAAPHIVNASFANVGSEVLLHSLEDRGIYISAGSACSTHKRAASPTMTAIGVDKSVSSSAVRFSFSELNTEEEVDATLAALRELLPMLRRYTAR